MSDLSPILALPALLALLLLPACSTTTTARAGLPPLQTVESVDLQRYLGTWYEIASFPQSFQRGCTGTTATYALKDDGEIEVLNRCRRGSLTGRETTATGRARVTDAATNARLEVSFFGPFWGDYWIVDVGQDYEYAVVGHPGRDYLWILSRTPALEDTVYAGVIERLVAQGYDTARLVRTVQ